MLTTHLSIDLKVEEGFLKVSLVDTSFGTPTVISTASVSLESLQIAQ